jgi:hypothetical protein
MPLEGTTAARQREARIWYQSFVHPREQAPYIELLQAGASSLKFNEFQNFF